MADAAAGNPYHQHILKQDMGKKDEVGYSEIEHWFKQGELLFPDFYQ